jgi:hypothetical protein
MDDDGLAFRTPLPRALMWTRTDVPGSEFVAFDDRSGVRARGSQHAVDPVPYALTYDLRVDDTWTPTSLTLHAEGATWTRDLELLRTEDGWAGIGAAEGEPSLAAFDGSALRAPTPPGVAEPSSLRYALDVDIGGSPFTNALTVRRLGLLNGRPGRETELIAAWVLPPTLEVVASHQWYRSLGDRLIRYGDAATGVDIHFGADGWVDDYPGLAHRVDRS